MSFAVVAIRVSVAAIIVATLCAAGLVLYARSQGLLILSVQTGSMRPAIRPGDAVLVKAGSVTADRLHPGDIISFRSLEHPDVIITHRLVGVDPATGLLVTRGDAERFADPPFGAQQVVGIVDRAVPLAGYGFDALRHPAGLAATVYAPSLALVVWEVRRLMRHYEHQRYVLYYY